MSVGSETTMNFKNILEAKPIQGLVLSDELNPIGSNQSTPEKKQRSSIVDSNISRSLHVRASDASQPS